MDNGMGIIETEIQKLFTLFGRLDESKVDNLVNNEGIGLGLYICKQIIDRAGGKINCFSAGLGLGSTFMFSIHMVEARSI